MKRILIVLIYMILLLPFSIAYAVTGRDLIDRANSIAKPDTAVSELKMLIHKEKRTTEKIFTVDTKIFNGNERKTLVAFLKPTRIKLLTVSHKSREDDQWLRMSGGRIKRITTSTKNKPFVNSHFTYEDMISRNIDHYSYKRLKDAKVSGELCYRVKSTKTKGRRIYDKTVLYIRTKDYFIIRVDFYRDGKFLKYLANYNIKKTGGIITPYKIVMTSATKGRTELFIRKIQYNVPVNDSKFRKESLR